MLKHTTAGWLPLLLITLGIGLPLWGDDPFDYFDNSWSVIGLKDYARGTRITPDNKLIIGAPVGTGEKEADKASVQIRFGKDLTPLSREQTKRLMDGWLPIVLLNAEDGPIRYEFTFWAAPLPSAAPGRSGGAPSVNDWRRAFDGPSEGENFLNWVAVRVVNTGSAVAEAKLRIEQAGPYEK